MAYTISSDGQRVTTFIDEFNVPDGTACDPDYWTTSRNIFNGNLHNDTSNPTSQTTIQPTTAFQLEGKFDVEFGTIYNAETVQPVATGNHGLGFDILETGADTGYAMHSYYDATSGGYRYTLQKEGGGLEHALTNEGPSGKLRIVRNSNDDIIVYHWSVANSRWEWDGDAAGFIQYTNRTGAYTFRSFFKQTEVRMKGGIDYFKVNSADSIDWGAAPNQPFTVVDDEANIIYKSMPQVTDIQSTVKRITDPIADFDDEFGTAVAVGSGRIVVGAPFDDPTLQGSAHLYDIDGTFIARIVDPAPVVTDNYGHSVAIGSGRVVVGAIGEDSDKGAAHIFDLEGTYITKISDPAGVADDEFGWSVAAGCGRIVCGSRLDNTSLGSAHIFDLDGTFITSIVDPNGSGASFFGSSCSVGNGRIVVGASQEATGTGSAHIFDLDGNYIKKLVDPLGSGNNFFGVSVSVGCGKIVVGSSGQDSSQGAIHIFDLNGNYISKVVDPIGVAGDKFGFSVSIGNDLIAVGAPIDGTGDGSVHLVDLDGNYLYRIGHTTNSERLGTSVSIGSGRLVAGAPLTNLDTGAADVFEVSEHTNSYWDRVLDTYRR